MMLCPNNIGSRNKSGLPIFFYTSVKNLSFFLQPYQNLIKPTKLDKVYFRLGWVRLGDNNTKEITQMR